ncbi:MAG: SDR family NAD(P)-dependent oxidoreductase [Bryobacterales bacterium]|nr:SDR family NAD(P)-dependent oxidoreductase [Bryobacterales bacterium]
MRIQGKVAVITGASQGIGAACAAALRERGARLVLTARRKEKLEQAGGPEAVVVAGDITEEQTRARLVEAALANFGAIDILINNAGAGLYERTWETSPERARALFELNFFAPLDLIRRVVPHMRARRSGVIVNISSIAGKVTLPWLPLYSVSKSALEALSNALRMELMPEGVRAMTVCPGYVITGFRENALTGRPPRGVEESGAFRITARECAAAVVRGLERDARTVVTPPAGWPLAWAARLFPSLVERRLSAMLHAAEDGS